MREIPREGNHYRFIVKALREAGNELAEDLWNVGRRRADLKTADGWSYRLLAAHLRDNEEMNVTYLEQMLRRRNPELEAIDAERVLDDPDACRDRVDSLVGEYVRLRQETLDLLWGLSEKAWERKGTHVYRGELTVIQLARELHLHDLEHLWQVRQMHESLSLAH